MLLALVLLAAPLNFTQDLPPSRGIYAEQVCIEESVLWRLSPDSRANHVGTWEGVEAYTCYPWTCQGFHCCQASRENTCELWSNSAEDCRPQFAVQTAGFCFGFKCVPCTTTNWWWTHCSVTDRSGSTFSAYLKGGAISAETVEWGQTFELGDAAVGVPVPGSLCISDDPLRCFF